MLLLVSHFTKNKGTTDYFSEYLKKNKIPYYYLRHPFNFAELKYSELIFFDGKNEFLAGKYEKINNATLDLIRNAFVSVRISLKLSKKIDKVISFGSFNVIPFIFLKKTFKRKVYFWGVDYSRSRFKSKFLNQLYAFFETCSCRYSDAIIQPTKRQEDARVKFHKLERAKSLIVPNGTGEIKLTKSFSAYKEIALVYMGSITAQHGILEFIKYFYLKKKLNYKLYIFGAGELECELVDLIRRSNLENKIIFLGFKKQNEILDFLEKANKRLFGIAPYNDKSNDHVYYGDSLKIKEYLSFNIPFITSQIAYIPFEIREFGFIYADFEKLAQFFEELAGNFEFNERDKNVVLERYQWENIFGELMTKIK